MNQSSDTVVVVGSLAVGFDRATGRELWRYDPDTPLKTIHRYVFHAGRLFLLDAKGRVHCISAADGAPFGVVDLKLKSGHAMVADGDCVFVLGERALVALGLDGTVRWRAAFDGVGSSWGLLGLGVPGNAQQPDYSRS